MRNIFGLPITLFFLTFLFVPATVSAFTIPQDVKVKSDIEYGNAGGHSLRLDLYTPKNTISNKLPVIILIHGGGWTQGHKTTWAELASDFAERGYAAASIDYRFITEAKYPACLEDCVTAVNWVVKNAGAKGLDGEKIGLFGESAGAHLALMTGFTGDQYGGEDGSIKKAVKCVAVLYPPTDMKIHFEHNAKTQALFGGTYEEMPEAYMKASPVTYAVKGVPPTLILHGEADKVILMKEPEELFDLLKKAGVYSDLIKVPGAPHGFKPAAHSSKYGREFQSLAGFYDRFLK